MNEKDGNKQHQKEFIMEFQEVANKTILETPMQWHVPLVNDGKTIGEVTLLNRHVMKIINNFSLLPDIVFPNRVDEHGKWNESIEYYQQVVELLHVWNCLKMMMLVV